MLIKAQNTIKEHKMFQQGDKVIVAVSGGPDSLVLLHLLDRLSHIWDLQLIVAHFNHMLRPEAEEEGDYVSQLADKLGHPTVIGQGDVSQKAAQSGLSIQMAARELRYDFFAKLAAETGSQKIALAHHLDDQAETIVMNFLRGAGPRGLGGIPPVRGKIVRPLLAITREEIEYYVEENSLEPIWDPSNYEKVYHRNRIRLELMPVLQRYNSNLNNRLARVAEIFREEDQYLDELAMGKFAQICSYEQDGRLSLDFIGYQELAKALKRRILRQCFYSLVPLGQEEIGFDHIERALLWLEDPQLGKTLEWPEGICINFMGQQIMIGQKESQFPGEDFQLLLTDLGQISLPGGFLKVTGLSKEAMPWERVKDCPPWEALVDGEKVVFPLTIRNRRPGDRIHPLGAGGSKKLKDFFIDLKIPRQYRHQIPLVVSATGEIIWVVGYRLDERFKISSTTKNFLHLSFTKNYSDEIV